jgi:hypothetical protein
VIRESRLGRVPHAASALDADRVGGLTATDLRLKCPSDTFPTADVCVETQARGPAPYGSAVLTCAFAGAAGTPGRRLPTHGELVAALGGSDLAPGGELTSDVSPSSTRPGEVDVLYITTKTGGVGVTNDTAAGAKAFRCVVDPSN